MSQPTYIAEMVEARDGSEDIRITINGKVWHLWGRDTVSRETELARNVPENTLPVLIGSGLGIALDALLQQGRPVAVVDSETTILETTLLKDQYATNSNILWLTSGSAEEIINQLNQWQQKNNDARFHPVIFPLYLRLNRDHYGPLANWIKENAQPDFWSQARYPKFQSSSPRILFLDSSYFLCSEILSALDRLAIEHHTLSLDKSGIGSQSFIESLLATVIDFRPDFLLTVNHFGLDREGKLAELLAKLELPLASWFVDNPHLILHHYAHPGANNTAIFTYDAGNLEQMKRKGFNNVHHLPLATDPERFKPNPKAAIPNSWASDVSFVGNSMTAPVAKSLALANLPAPLDEEYEAVAQAFDASSEKSVIEFLRAHSPNWLKAWQSLTTIESKLALESLITWEATRQYRLGCVKKTLPYSPLIVGDEGWKSLLKTGDWRYISGLDYYKELPNFYPQSKINFNCTSRQMIGAVNQRVFDVPASGGFLLTDYREQMESLFDLKSEVVVYNTIEEIPGLIEKYLRDEKTRQKISESARKRILAEHTYDIRLNTLIGIMKDTF